MFLLACHLFIGQPTLSAVAIPKECAAIGCTEEATGSSSLSFHIFPSAEKEHDRLKQLLAKMNRLAACIIVVHF